MIGGAHSTWILGQFLQLSWGHRNVLFGLVMTFWSGSICSDNKCLDSLSESWFVRCKNCSHFLTHSPLPGLFSSIIDVSITLPGLCFVWPVTHCQLPGLYYSTSWRFCFRTLFSSLWYFLSIVFFAVHCLGCINLFPTLLMHCLGVNLFPTLSLSVLYKFLPDTS